MTTTTTNQGLSRLEENFSSVKRDIQDAWDFPVRSNSKITGEWVYAIDSESMEFVENLLSYMPSYFSMMTLYSEIMKRNTIKELMANIK